LAAASDGSTPAGSHFSTTARVARGVSPAVQSDLVSFENPLGSISNSDLELAGNLCHQDVLVNGTPCDELTLASLSDNTPAVAWMKRGSISGDGPAAYLLRLAALHRRHYSIHRRNHGSYASCGYRASTACRRKVTPFDCAMYNSSSTTPGWTFSLVPLWTYFYLPLQL
jgi:hypothetical protein